MPWLQLSVRVPSEDVAKVEPLIELAGAASISLADAADEPLFEPAPGDTPLWPAVTVNALFEAGADIEAIQALIAGVLGADARVAVETVADEDWLAAAAARVAAKRFGRLILAPAEDTVQDDDAAVLNLHMGLAFGTGEHPTTALCLAWLEASLTPGSIVLDYGCGSGVLALAALKLGAVRAFAVDNDPQAVAATARNAELNGLGRKLWAGAPESLPAFRADVILANILAQPLIERAPLFAERLVSGGVIVLSGVLPVQGEQVVDAYDPHFEDIVVTELDGWLRIVARRRMRC